MGWMCRMGVQRKGWWASLGPRADPRLAQESRHSLPHFASSGAIHTITFC